MCKLQSTLEVVADGLCDANEKPPSNEICNDDPCEVRLLLRKEICKFLNRIIIVSQVLLHIKNFIYVLQFVRSSGISMATVSVRGY